MITYALKKQATDGKMRLTDITDMENFFCSFERKPLSLSRYRIGFCMVRGTMKKEKHSAMRYFRWTAILLCLIGITACRQENVFHIPMPRQVIMSTEHI